MHWIRWFNFSIVLAVSCVTGFPINHSMYKSHSGYVNKAPAQAFDVPQWNPGGANVNGVPQVFNFYNSYPTFTYQGCCHGCTGPSCPSNCGTGNTPTDTNTESSVRNLPEPLPLASPQTYLPVPHIETYPPGQEPHGLYLPPSKDTRDRLSPALTNIVLPLPHSHAGSNSSHTDSSKHSKNHASEESEKHSKTHLPEKSDTHSEDHAADEPGKHVPKHSSKTKQGGHSTDMDTAESAHSNSTKHKNHSRRVNKHKITHVEDASYESGETTENPNIVFDSTTTLTPGMDN